ncbi:MAG: gluconokinase [Treponema sp.]|nr:gluconokinase [Treponema sp.]
MAGNKDCVLAVDIGTSSVRCMVFVPDGTIHARSQIKYPTIKPKPYFEEQDPDLVRDETLAAIDECLRQSTAFPERIAAIAFSSQMYSVFPVDLRGKPLYGNILWCDARAEAQAEALKALPVAEELYRVTGCPVNSIYPLAKLLWLREKEPDVFKKAAHFISIKEYITEYLTMEYAVDCSMMSGTGMCDIANYCWDLKALELTGIGAQKLSRPVSADEALPFRNTALLHRWNLPEDVAVFSGGGDGPLANLGSGASKPGAVNIDLGTSGAARVVVDRPLDGGSGGLWCYCLTPSQWTLGGILTNVGNAYQWLCECLTGFTSGGPTEGEMSRLDVAANDIPPGAEGVIFLPYLRKPRSPWWDSSLKGCILGLRSDHHAGHITRALFEAIAYDAKVIIESMNRLSPIKKEIVVTGGFAKNHFMAQLLSDVFGREVAVPENNEGSIAGAALIALKGSGLTPDYTFTGETNRRYSRFTPNVKNAKRYAELGSEYVKTVAVFQNFWQQQGAGK